MYVTHSLVFLSTAHIRGVEVIAKETFTLTQEAVKLNSDWFYERMGTGDPVDCTDKFTVGRHLKQARQTNLHTQLSF